LIIDLHVILKLVCVHCGTSFEGDNEKFCSDGCRNSYTESIKKRAKNAVENDSGHTKKLSDTL